MNHRYRKQTVREWGVVGVGEMGEGIKQEQNRTMDRDNRVVMTRGQGSGAGGRG